MSYILQNPVHLLGLVGQHMGITLAALLIASLIALPLSMLIAARRTLAMLVLGIFGVIYTIPSLALIIMLLPIFGLNAKAVIAALVLYSQVILLRNLLAGFESVDPALLEAARGMGMSDWQRWRRVHLPLALPVILAGMRITAVTMIAIATIGAKFGAGGLGTLLFEGIAQPGRYDKIWAGALAVAALALAINSLFLWLERRLTGYTRWNAPARAVPAGKSSLG